MRVVKYQRISTNHQDLENQTQSIDTQIERLDWDCVGEYKEVESGMKSRDSRPELRRLLRDSRLRMFDRVMVYSLDRLGRSVVDVINTINELEEVGVNVFVVKNSIDTSTSQEVQHIITTSNTNVGRRRGSYFSFFPTDLHHLLFVAHFSPFLFQRKK